MNVIISLLAGYSVYYASCAFRLNSSIGFLNFVAHHQRIIGRKWSYQQAFVHHNITSPAFKKSSESYLSLPLVSWPHFFLWTLNIVAVLLLHSKVKLVHWTLSIPVCWSVFHNFHWKGKHDQDLLIFEVATVHTGDFQWCIKDMLGSWSALWFCTMNQSELPWASDMLDLGFAPRMKIKERYNGTRTFC